MKNKSKKIKNDKSAKFTPGFMDKMTLTSNLGNLCNQNLGELTINELTNLIKTAKFLRKQDKKRFDGGKLAPLWQVVAKQINSSNGPLFDEPDLLDELSSKWIFKELVILGLDTLTMANIVEHATSKKQETLYELMMGGN
jgi:hypothetical protein